jgi:D-beta-D-heptose 7-phosphate kinase/D-beta-D-heptose 1-phosphate adenosyltransferase
MLKSKKIFTNGCFDVIHVGHYSLLRYCQLLACGGEVIVAIDTDEKIREDKGEYRPIFCVLDRVINLKAAQYVLGNLTIFVFDSNKSLYDLIDSVKPDYIVKGSDWEGKHVIGSNLAEVKYFPLIEQMSSSNIIDAVRKNYLKELNDKLSGIKLL